MVAIPSTISIPLLTQDASDIILGALLQPTWGVYLNGMPVLSPAPFNGGGGLTGALATALQVVGTIGNVASSISNIGAALTGGGTIPLPVIPAIASTVEFDYGQDYPVATYPQEQGAFQSYNKVTLPFDVRLRVCAGGSLTARQGFLYTCQAIAASTQLFSIITPEMTFSSVNCVHISWRRTAKRNNTLIEVDLGFLQVKVVSAVSFGSTAAPTDSGSAGLGGVQPTSAPTPFVTGGPPVPFINLGSVF